MSFCLACFFAQVALVAQSQQPVLIHAADLQADAAILREAYQALHPGLYRYNDRAQMDASFAELNRQLGHDETLQEAFLTFSQFAAKVRCGHTYANPFNQSKTVTQSLLEGPMRVPFYFEWLDRRMIVTQDFSQGRAFPAGTEIVSINGVPTQSILARLLTVARADGANDSKRVAQLAVTGASKYETFDIYYPLFFPPASSRFDFVVQRPGSKRQKHFSAEALTSSSASHP